MQVWTFLARSLGAAFIALGLLTNAVNADETISGVTINALKTSTGFCYNEWTVTATFTVTRAVKPTVTIYFEVYLEETDVIDDNEFGPDYICIAPSSWVMNGLGQWKTSVTATFKSVSDWYGNDWDIDDECVDEVPCKDKHSRLGGWVDQNLAGNYTYRYLVENNPNGLAMNPSLTITAATIGPFSHSFVPPISSGGTRLLVDTSPFAPLAADTTMEGTVPYTLTFSNGTQQIGLVIGPSPISGVPALSVWGVLALLLLVVGGGALALKRP